MRFDSISLYNYRCHANLHIKLTPHFNVVVGINGSGKTSLLHGLCEALTGFTNFLSIPSGFLTPLADPEAVRVKVEAQTGRYRFEPQYPVTVEASGEAFGCTCKWSWTKRGEVDHPDGAGRMPGHAWQEKSRSDANEQVTAPVLAFYRADRNWPRAQPQEMQAATTRQSRADGYALWWNASSDSASLQSWVIAKCLERFQSSLESGATFESISTDELALVNKAISKAVEEVKGLRFDIRKRSLLVEWVNGENETKEPTAFEHLSDGQRAIIGLVADVARRMCILNPHLGQEVTNQTPGVVLIDELDIHLHPRWQRSMTSGLKHAFPKVQFIAASHSPQVLGELQAEEILLLRPEGSTHPQVSYGLTSSQVLEEIMGSNSRNEEIEKLLSEVFEALEQKDLGRGRMLIDRLRSVAPGIPDLPGAEALLRRKEVLGK